MNAGKITIGCTAGLTALRNLLVSLLATALVSLSVIPAAEASTEDTVLTPQAREVATLLGILPKIERLIQLKRSNSNTDEELALRVDVLDKVMGGSLEVRMVSGRIGKELSWAFAGQGMLQARRQRNLNYLFVANFVQGGILGVLSGPAFLDGKPKTGTELLLIASSIGLGLSTLSLLESRSGTKPIDGGTTLLADVFHLNHPEEDHRPNIVLKYLNSVPPSAANHKTRIDMLIENWKKGHYLRSTSERQLQRLAALEPAVDRQRENIGLLSSRIRMLFDTQDAIEGLDTGLLDLVRVADN